MRMRTRYGVTTALVIAAFRGGVLRDEHAPKDLPLAAGKLHLKVSPDGTLSLDKLAGSLATASRLRGRWPQPKQTCKKGKHPESW
jgi:hypothetical protein